MLYKRGLAYQAEAFVNYDPVDKTVLANEQVDSSGRSWRSGALVQQINLRQWFFRIKAFQEDLLNDLDFLSQNNRWPERVVTQQRNWLGRSRGAKFQFDLISDTRGSELIDVFTTRPDTIFGVTYLALSLSHPIVTELTERDPDLQDFIGRKTTFTPDSKAGFKLPLKAQSPVCKDTSTIPVFAAPYVLEDYGEGAVMGVPAHDLRDLAFWKQHCPKMAIPIVVKPMGSKAQSGFVLPEKLNEAFVDHGVLTGLCNEYAGMESKHAGLRIVEDLQKDGNAEAQETWRLLDWLVSRQRYWGTPIPIIHCDNCGAVPVPDEDMPVQLPKLPASLQGQTGNPLEKITEWVNCSCPQCHQPARRETDTMDTFVDSSWYYARFPDPRNDLDLFSKVAAMSMFPVDTYVGGVEHAILHLLYARFIYKFLCSEGMIPSQTSEREPFLQLVAQGMVHGKTFSDPETGRFLHSNEVVLSGKRPVIVATGAEPAVSWEKMSKSKHNGVDPQTCIEKYGADATRAHVLFSAPVSEVLQWDEKALVGIQRWFGRVQELANIVHHFPDKVDINQHRITKSDIEHSSEAEIGVLLLTQDTIKAVTRKFNDIYSLNTIISDLMKLTNALYEADKGKLQETSVMIMLSALLKMLAPIAPAFAEQCWEDARLALLGASSILEASWPEEILTPGVEEEMRATKKSMVCAVQVNGKFKFTTQVPAPEAGKSKESKPDHEEEVVQAILASDMGRLWLTEKNDWARRKRVVVAGEGKLLNVVF